MNEVTMRKYALLFIFPIFLFSSNVGYEKLIPIYRYYHKEYKDHFYTKNPNPKGKWKSQGIAFYAYKDEHQGTIPIYRYYSKDQRNHFYTRNSNPKNPKEGKWKHQGIEFWAYLDMIPGTVGIHRFFRNDHKDHFYTKNRKQKKVWKYKRAEFYAITEEDYKIQLAMIKQQQQFAQLMLQQQQMFNSQLNQQESKINEAENERLEREKKLQEEFQQKMLLQQREFAEYQRKKSEEEEKIRNEFSAKLESERIKTNESMDQQEEREKLLKSEFEKQLSQNMEIYESKIKEEQQAREEAEVARLRSENRLELIAKFGDKMGELMFSNQVAKGMTETMVVISLGKPDDIKTEDGLIITTKKYTYKGKYILTFEQLPASSSVLKEIKKIK